MTKALVIGGGIGGTTAAMALQKAGVDAVVYEAYPTDAENIGAFLTLMNNGMTALRAIDAHQPVIDNSFAATGAAYISAGGKWVNERKYPENNRTVSLPRTLKRGVLNRIMHNELRARGVPVKHSKRMRHAETRPDGTVVAHFTDGTTDCGDLLIGADGLHSVTRRIIDPEAIEPRYVGLTILLGYTTKATPLAPPGLFQMYYGKRAFFGYIVDTSKETWWFARIPSPEIPRQQLYDTPTEQWRATAASFFTGDNIPAVEIIEKPGTIFPVNTYDLPSVRHWHNSSMVLLGDSAHAVSPSAGQGASLTVEDSVVLAKCIRDLPDLRTALATYENLRRYRVEQVIRTAMKADPAASRLRVFHRLIHDLKIRNEETRGRHPHSWIYDYDLDWDSAVTTLPT
jgi:FAD-dependent urate hydroxylase